MCAAGRDPRRGPPRRKPQLRGAGREEMETPVHAALPAGGRAGSNSQAPAWGRQHVAHSRGDTSGTDRRRRRDLRRLSPPQRATARAPCGDLSLRSVAQPPRLAPSFTAASGLAFPPPQAGAGLPPPKREEGGGQGEGDPPLNGASRHTGWPAGLPAAAAAAA